MILKPNRLEDEIRLYVTENCVPFTCQKDWLYITNSDNELIGFSVRTRHPIVLAANQNALGDNPMRPYVLKGKYQQTLLFQRQRVVAARILSAEEISIRERYPRTPLATPVGIQNIKTISPREYALTVDRYNIFKRAIGDDTLTLERHLLNRYF